MKASTAAALASAAPMPFVRAQGATEMIDPRRMLVGTLVFPHQMYQGGIGTILDRMQQLAGINTVMTFTHTHVSRQYRWQYTDPVDEQGNVMTETWVKTNPQYYSDPALQGRNPGSKYDDRDILEEMHAEMEPRGMKLYGRILEPYVITGAIAGFEDWREVNALGGETNHVCFNHPEYIAYWNSVVTDLVKTHPYLNGFKFGQERGGPLFSAFGKGVPGKCFCQYCTKFAKERGLDVENARQGLLAVQQYVRDIRSGKAPTDGNFVEFLRLLTRYPTLLPWEQFWMDSREAQRKRIYAIIKAINPDVQVGWHKDHGQTWDLLTRATTHYSEMGPYTDWLSVALYFGSMGRRSMNHFDAHYEQVLFGDAKNERDAYRMYLSMLGYDPDQQPALSEHREGDQHFHPEYVYAEAKRVVDNVGGAAEVHARIGFDHPGYDSGEGPEDVKQCVDLAFKAGVDGFWVGREWDELAEPNIKAYGEALRAYLKS